MKRNITCVSTLLGFVLLFNSPIAFAQSLTLGAYGGFLDQDGHYFFFDGKHQYLCVGDFTGLTGTPREYRNFLGYDLHNLKKPIASATLVYSNNARLSEDPSETYELHDVVTPINTLILGNGGIAGFNDLGDGVVYGSTLIDTSDVDRHDVTIRIPLNSIAIDAMNKSAGIFTLGGSITTLDRFPEEEYFDIRSIALDVTLVPEPTSAALVAFAAMIFGMRRSRTRSM